MIKDGRNWQLTVGVDAWRCERNVGKSAEVIEYRDTEAVLLCMVDKRTDVDALTAVSNARTHKQSSTTTWTLQTT